MNVAQKKKIKFFLLKKSAKITQKNAQIVLYRYDEEMKQKNILLIETKRAKKEPNEKIFLVKYTTEENSHSLLSHNDAKMRQKDINSGFPQGDCKI